MSTIKAIYQCGVWAKIAGAKREENPFIAISYKKAWEDGWDAPNAKKPVIFLSDLAKG